MKLVNSWVDVLVGLLWNCFSVFIWIETPEPQLHYKQCNHHVRRFQVLKTLLASVTHTHTHTHTEPPGQECCVTPSQRQVLFSVAPRVGPTNPDNTWPCRVWMAMHWPCRVWMAMHWPGCNLWLPAVGRGRIGPAFVLLTARWEVEENTYQQSSLILSWASRDLSWCIIAYPAIVCNSRDLLYFIPSNRL